MVALYNLMKDPHVRRIRMGNMVTGASVSSPVDKTLWAQVTVTTLGVEKMG